MHFRPEDRRRESSEFDEKIGATIAVSLKRKYLRGGAIPRIFPNSPSYSSSVTISRESPDSRRIPLENSALKTALNASVIDDLAYKKQKKFPNLDDIELKLNFLDRYYWSVIR